MIDLSSNSSADSSDDYRYGTGTGTGTRSRMFREQQRNGKRKRAESVQSDDERIYFGYPAVFDMECSECSGNSLYRHCIRRISTFLKDDINGNEVEFGLFVKRNDGGEGRVRRDDMLAEPSNSSRDTTTLTVEFTENEYRSVVDLEKTVDDISFETLSDQKPKNGIDLDDCLKLYTAAEVLDDVVWKCPSCNKTSEPSKQLHLWRLPEVLIVHLKRFLNERGMFGGVGRKNESKVRLAMEGLDLRPYLADSMNAVG